MTVQPELRYPKLHIVNTRPADRAAALTAYLIQAGYQVSCLPLLELVAQPHTLELQQQLSQTPQVDIVVVVSPTAVQLGLAHLQQLGVDATALKCHWIAVGQGTADVLLQAGIHAVVPRIETSEGMLALDIFQQYDASFTVMFWRGFGGRQFMLQTLQKQQHQTISVNLYRRQLPSDSADLYQQLLSHKPDVLLISSGASWQNWLEIGQKFQQHIIPAYILVLGERVQQMIESSLAEPLQTNVILLEDLRPQLIVSVLQQLFK